MHCLKYHSSRYTFSDVIRCTQMIIASYLIVVLILLSLVKCLNLGSTRFLEIIFFSSLGFFSDFELRTRKYLRIILRYLTYAKKGGGRGRGSETAMPPLIWNLNYVLKFMKIILKPSPPPCQPLPPNNTSDTLSEKKVLDPYMFIHVFTFFGCTSIWVWLLLCLNIWFNLVHW